MKFIESIKRNIKSIARAIFPGGEKERQGAEEGAEQGEGGDAQQPSNKVVAFFRKKPIFLWAAVVLAVFLFVLLSNPWSTMPAPDGNVQQPGQTATPQPTTDPSLSATPTPALTGTPTPTPTPLPEIMEHLKPLYEQNDDLVGWLKIEGTVVDYPVMWTPPEMDDFYLYRTFDKEDDPSKRGTLFIDKFNSVMPRDTNLLVHGHNMRDGSMLAVLLRYKDVNFYMNHPTFEYSSLYYTDEYEIVSVFLSRVYNVDDDVFKFYKFYNAETQEEFDDFIANIKELELYPTGVTAEFGDKLVTLSTCDYSFQDGRMVIVGRAKTE